MAIPDGIQTLSAAFSLCVNHCMLSLVANLTQRDSTANCVCSCMDILEGPWANYLSEQPEAGPRFVS